MFANCTGITGVILPEGVTKIGYNAFYSCYNLTSITVPASVTEIEPNAFQTYSDLTVRGYSGTRAESFAQENDIPFESLGSVSLKGDIDGNGAIELDDAQLALAAYTNQLAHKPSGLTAEQETTADVTGDGEVTVDDAQAILQFYTETLAHKNPTWDKILHPDN